MRKENNNSRIERLTMGAIWSKFAENRDKLGCAKAYSRLRHDLAENFDALSPEYMTPKELHSIIESTEQFTKSDRDADNATDPKELVSGWLRGEIDLSRIPLEKPVEMKEA